MSAPIAPERVLPTLNADGTRFLIRPRLYRGRFERARKIAAYALMGFFVMAPFLQVGGKPLVLLDLPRREFVLIGRTYLPTDGPLLMLLLLTILFGVVLTTALVGRAWCGWACPQTVYMEFLFRPIERLFEGKREEQLRRDRQGGGSPRRLAKNAVYAVLSLLLGNVFLAYFVGVRTLSQWMQSSPFERPTPFLVMAVTAGLVFFDFAYFREQMCTVVCPYARLQSVLLDRRSLIVGYDARRGEPRTKGKPRAGSGDCIDCSACVAACPTGIDIRHGLQLECIACAQCVDACDSIMDKIKKPRGLIRYSAQATLEDGAPSRIVRVRTVAYSLLFVALGSLLFIFGGRKVAAEVTVLRGIGAPYQVASGQVTNQIRIKIRNRTDSTERYEFALNHTTARLIAPENPLSVKAGAQRETSVFVSAPPDAFRGGELGLDFRVTTSSGFQAIQHYKLLGPKSGSGEQP
jgi:cytochrome c oxidase accessory protein FixG